jgi:predicted DNA-binding transcriptional regulator YafY
MPRGRKSGSYTQTQRVELILSLLRSHRLGLTIAEIAERCSVDPKTIMRALPILADRGHETFFEMVGEQRHLKLREDALETHTVVLNESERLALLAMRQVFDVLRDTPLGEGVETLLGKITHGFKKDAHERIEGNRARFIYLPEGGPKTYAGKMDVLDGLWDGVLRSRRVRYRYERAGKPKRQGVLEPFAMALYKQGLYVIGRDVEMDEAPRVFAAERFSQAEPIKDSKFEVPKGFNPESFFDGAFGIFHGNERIEVVVDFSVEAAPLIRARKWHASQTIEDLDMGDVRLRMHVAHTAQVLPWLLSWGARARPVAPASLVAEYDEAIAAMVARASRRRPGLTSARPANDVARKRKRA